MLYRLILINFGIISGGFISGALAADQLSLQETTPITHYTATSSSASSVPEIMLPDDQKQWQQTVLDYYAPILADDTVTQKLRELLQFTMPTHGNFNPINIDRRREAIQTTYKILSRLARTTDPITEQCTYLDKLMERHKKYLP